MKFLLNAIRVALDSARVFGGSIAYLFTGTTSAPVYQAFVRLFCATGGRSNDAFSQVIALAHPPLELPEGGGALGAGIASETSAAVAALREDGFYVFRHRLPEELCNRLTQFALTHPCEVRQADDGHRHANPSRVYAEDRAAPVATRYDFSMQDLVDDPTVQSLLAEPALLRVAQDYFGSRPVADVLGLWWNTAFSPNPSEEAAQFYHFDLDRPKWIKVFFHLTDVTEASGPHCFVRGSHKTDGIPNRLLSRGYVRLTDQDVAANFQADRVVEFRVPKGTILVEDTRGLHKGRTLTSGDRLMFQIQYSNSLFGGSYEKVRVSQFRDEAFRRYASSMPKVYQAVL